MLDKLKGHRRKLTIGEIDEQALKDVKEIKRREQIKASVMQGDELQIPSASEVQRFTQGQGFRQKIYEIGNQLTRSQEASPAEQSARMVM